MTIYDLLRELVSAAPFQEPKRYDALKLINELDNMNALGTVAKQIEAQAHECQGVWQDGTYRCCTCQKPMGGTAGGIRPRGHYDNWGYRSQ